MSYAVTVIAPDVTPAQLEAARAQFCEVLETGLGSQSQVAPCFQSWAKLEEHGVAALSETEDRAAGAWIRAHHAAEVAARATLGPQSNAGFLIRLRPTS